jgi:hypothetical protein
MNIFLAYNLLHKIIDHPKILGCFCVRKSINWKEIVDFTEFGGGFPTNLVRSVAGK